MIIVGAGLAGLLAANMLRRHQPQVREAQAGLPNNHAALLRFRTDGVSRVTGIPFKKVNVYKDALSDHESPIGICNLYSEKVTGEVSERSILNLDTAERYIAPPDFISLMSRGCDIHYGMRLLSVNEMGATWTGKIFRPSENPMISTIPMPLLMDIVDWPKIDRPEFRWRPVWSVTGDVDLPKVDVYQTIYFPDRGIAYYRASLTGNRLIIESMEESAVTEGSLWIEDVCIVFGLDGALVSNIKVTKQEYGKILPTEDEQKRRAFILAMTDRYNIYSLGRFATWRQILLDDVVQDIQFIDDCISQRDLYQTRLRNV